MDQSPEKLTRMPMVTHAIKRSLLNDRKKSK